MEHINKRTNEPKKLVKFRKKYRLTEKIRLDKNIDFKDLDQTINQHLRNILLEDQGFLCCYCQKRIPENKLPKTKIEHFLCQENNKDKIFDFRNLFIACNGKIGQIETCDTSKKSKELKSVDFFNVGIFSMIKFTKTGYMYSDDHSIEDDLKVLNLNDQNLMKSRQSIYKSIQNIKKHIHKKGGDFDFKIGKVRKEWEDKDENGKYKEFKGTGLYYLR